MSRSHRRGGSNSGSRFNTTDDGRSCRLFVRIVLKSLEVDVSPPENPTGCHEVSCCGVSVLFAVVRRGFAEMAGVPLARLPMLTSLIRSSRGSCGRLSARGPSTAVAGGREGEGRERGGGQEAAWKERSWWFGALVAPCWYWREMKRQRAGTYLRHLRLALLRQQHGKEAAPG